MKRISFIIPVYNLENYISVTLESCLRQDVPLEDYEIICVNDGSSDKSEDVVLSYASKYPNIKLHSQENAGVSAARNKGIELANGKYIWFVDGDDVIADNCLGALLQILEENSIDVLDLGIQSVSERVAFEAKKIECRICPDGADKLMFMSSKGGVGGGVWGQIFKAEVLKHNEIFFSREIKYSEDVLFGFKALIKAERCAKTDSVLYHYYQRPGSAMHSSNHIKHIESMHLLAAEYLKIADGEKEWREVAISKKNYAVKALLFSLVQNGDVKLANKWMTTLCEDNLYPFPFLWESLRGNVTKKQAIINYSSFLFPWKWYFMTCVRLIALKKRLRGKNK